MEIKTSWDDGDECDLRIAELLEKYDLTGTFYIPNTSILSAYDIEVLAQDFEIGGHTVTHPADLKRLDNDSLWFEVYKNKCDLEDVIGRQINSFCYPRGRYNKKVIDCVKKAGYISARTTKVLNIEKPINMYEIVTTIHVYPNRVEYANRNWLELAKELFVQAKEQDKLFNIWGHSWEIERYQMWDELEDLFNFIKRYGNESH